MKTFLFLYLLFAPASVEALTVTKSGIVVEVPDGWQASVGTCTGDWGYSQPGALLTIGHRRFIAPEEDWRSTADVYVIHSFADLSIVVPKYWSVSPGDLTYSATVVSRAGMNVLRFDFSKVPVGKELMFVKAAFVEQPDGDGAVEVRLLTRERSPEAEQAFEAAVQSLSKAAQPGATDNPDDAQRLREDH